MKLFIATWGEPSIWNKVKYEFDGVREEACSSLSILKKVLKPDKTIIVVSDTLVGKTLYVKKCEEDRRNAPVVDALRLKELNYKSVIELIKSYIRKTAEVFNTGVDDVWVIPSVGFFKNATVEGSFSDFRYFLFIQFFNNFDELIKDDTLDVFLDVTLGHNFLPTFTNEILNTVLSIAAYFLKEVKLSVLISDPFHQNYSEVLRIHKIFDERPIIPQPYRFCVKKLNFLGNYKEKRNLQDIMIPINNLKNTIPKVFKGEDLKKKVSAFLGAVNNALPLVLLYSYLDPKYISDLLGIVVEKYEENTLVEETKGKIFIKRRLKFLPEVEVFSTYGMYLKGLKNKYNELVETIDIEKIKEKGVSFKFLKIIKDLWSFNEKDEVIITKEVGSLEKKGDIERKVEKYLKQKGISQFDWISLRKIEDAITNTNSSSKDKNLEEQTADSIESPLELGYPERNFLAHAGLTKNIIELKVERGELFIRYNLDAKELNIWKAAAKGLKPLVI
ncbi:MAG: TIGR01897 family CRISPR-associated protein [Aquificae bacterium]|nr:TIGR01897 family CRISPR-associated protein [Aquificota bacterium]